MNRLKELRQEKKLSQKELAKKIGVHYRTLQNWENGESQIKPDKAEKLADFFGVSVGYLLGYDIETFTQNQSSPISDKGRFIYSSYLSDDKITEYERKVYEKYQRIGKTKNVGISVSGLSNVGISQKEYNQLSANVFADNEIANFFTALTYLTDLERSALVYFSSLKKDTQKSLLDILKTLAENNN